MHHQLQPQYNSFFIYEVPSTTPLLAAFHTSMKLAASGRNTPYHFRGKILPVWVGVFGWNALSYIAGFSKEIEFGGKNPAQTRLRPCVKVIILKT